MEKPLSFDPSAKFETPEQELSYLRERLAEREAEAGGLASRERLATEAVAEYKQASPEAVLHPEFKLDKRAAEEIVLKLSPEVHDQKMAELLHILQKHGIRNALAVVRQMEDPHLEDDFDRFLVQYLKAGFPIKGLHEGEPMSKALRMTLYEISLPERGDDSQKKTLKELISSMEQFYAGMLSLADAKGDVAPYFTLEIAVANHSDEFVFYAAVPDARKNLFEKQALSIFPHARVTEKPDDYNIFNEKGGSVGSYATLEENPAFALKTYEQFETDPLNVILNSFSKIKRDGEGAAIQIVFQPAPAHYLKKYKTVLERIQKGMKVKDALNMPETFLEHAAEMGRQFVGGGKAGKDAKQKAKDDEKKDEIRHVDENVVKSVTQKIGSQIVRTNIRIVASAHTEAAAGAILADLESAFNQFENTHGNKLTFTRVKKTMLNRRLVEEFFSQFAFRLWNEREAMPLNLSELTTLMHFPGESIGLTPQLKTAKAGTAPAPLDLPQDGILLGINRNRGIDTRVFMTKEDRLRHFYAIGQTGTGKTTLLKNMIIQDIQNGDGVCMIDPHGSDIQDVLAAIPRERYEDVIYFDPSNSERPMGLNMLEYDARYPEQKTFVVNEMLSIFDKLFDMKTSGGPMFEQYFRNAVLLVLEDPETGSTLLDVSRVLSQKAYRELKLSRCKNPIVVQFWREVAEKAGGESALANIVPYITSKFDVFLSNEIMRPIIAQQQSTFNFREIMDGKKILLVNLAKGRLGDINSHLVGLILVGKILMAALSRVDSLQGNPPPFYLYIDEFQNITTKSIATILSEARKYKLSLHIAHQFIAQLEEPIKDAVFGNVGSMASFRVGVEDAEFLEKQFAPVFAAKDIINIDNFNAYLKLLIHGKPVKPFNIETMLFPKGNPQIAEKLKELSSLKFGRDRADIEAEIMRKYEKKAVPAAVAAAAVPAGK